MWVPWMFLFYFSTEKHWWNWGFGFYPWKHKLSMITVKDCPYILNSIVRYITLKYFRIFSNMRLMDPEPIIFTMLAHALTGVWHQLGIGATNWIKRIIIPFLNYVGSLALMEISKVEEKWRIYSCTKKYSESYALFVTSKIEFSNSRIQSAAKCI